MRLPRMTTRRWIVIIAAGGLMLGAQQLRERRAYFLVRAEVEASRADDLENGRCCLREEFCVPGYAERLLAHYQALARKYEHAASMPWIDVEADEDHPEP